MFVHVRVSELMSNILKSKKKEKGKNIVCVCLYNMNKINPIKNQVNRLLSIIIVFVTSIWEYLKIKNFFFYKDE